MSNTTLHYGLKQALPYMREGGRWAVLTVYILHANIRNRAWPGIKTLTEQSGWEKNSVISAKEWLVEYKALKPVPLELRIEEERNLHHRCDVMEITGKLQLDWKTFQILYFNEPHNESDASPFDHPIPSQEGHYTSNSLLDKRLLSQPEVVTTSEVLEVIQDELIQDQSLGNTSDEITSDLPSEICAIWQTAYDQLQFQMPREAFDTWLRGACLLAYDASAARFTIGVQNIYAQAWLEQRLRITVTRTLSQIAGRVIGVQFVLFSEFVRTE